MSEVLDVSSCPTLPQINNDLANVRNCHIIQHTTGSPTHDKIGHWTLKVPILLKISIPGTYSQFTSIVNISSIQIVFGFKKICHKCPCYIHKVSQNIFFEILSLINFREWFFSRFFANINFREWPYFRYFALINFRKFFKFAKVYERESFCT